MSKNTKTSKNNKSQLSGKINPKRLPKFYAIITFAVLGFIILSIITSVIVSREVIKQTLLKDYVDIRLNLTEAVRGLKQPTPQDYRTGDFYIPSMKIYIPSSQFESYETLYYTYQQGATPADDILMLTTRSLMARTSKILAAESIDDAFNKMPEVQACVRGLSIYKSEQPNSSLKLFKTINSSRSKYYVYSEPDCPELTQKFANFNTIVDY